jgi:hypothetical protein
VSPIHWTSTLAILLTSFLPPPMIGVPGSNGESVPNESMNPLFLF